MLLHARLAGAWARGKEVLLSALLPLVAIVLVSPLLLLIAATIALVDGRPICFRQERLGLNGQRFWIHKFRTLDPGTPDDAVTPEGDPHATRLGGWLRRVRLDELPQLFDVLLGAMALVGPRPERAVDLAGVDPTSRERFLAIKPGLTGPVQLEFIAEDSVLRTLDEPAGHYRGVLVPAKVAANLRAFQNRSLGADLLCVLRTPWVMVSPRQRARSEDVVREVLAGSSP